MPLQLVLETPCLRACHEAANDILFLEWQECVTLSAVQVASCQLAQLTAARPYRRVLVSTQHVGRIGREVPAWAVRSLLPGLRLMGVEHLAWVSSSSLEVLRLADHLIRQFPTTQGSLFADVEHAVNWLRQQAAATLSPPAVARPASEARRLHRVVQVVNWQVLTRLARHPLWPVVEGGNLPPRLIINKVASYALCG